MHNLWDDEEVQWAKIRCMKISFCLLLLFLFLLCIREIHLRKKMILYKTTPFLQIHIMYLGHKHIYEYIHHQTFTSLSINLNQKIHFIISFLKYISFGNIMGILLIIKLTLILLISANLVLPYFKMKNYWVRKV